jgi:hypothetical protein
MSKISVRTVAIGGVAGAGLLFGMSVAGSGTTPAWLSNSAWAQKGHKDSHTDDTHSDQDRGPKRGRGPRRGTDTPRGSDTHRGKESEKIYRGGKKPSSKARATDRVPGKAGTTGPKGKGSLFGDLYVVKRNPDGTLVTEVVDGVTYAFILNKDGEWVRVPLDEKNKYEVPEDIKDTLVEVELSRLNVARSPRIVDQRLSEVLALLNSATSITTDLAGRLVVTYVEGGQTVTKTIDSPTDNLVLYLTLLKNGYLPGLTVSDSVLGSLTYLKDPSKTVADLAAAASFLAAASDKTVKVTADAIVYLNRILSIPGTSGVPTLTDVTGTYVDYASYATSYTYDRTVYDVYIKVRDIATGDEKVVKLTDILGGSITTLSGFAAFTQATDDARAVISYVHDNPVLEVCGASPC